MKYLERIIPEIKQSYFLFGPRGSGKSTWLRHAYPRALFIDLLDPVLFRELSSRPESLEAMVAGSLRGEPIIIDEVQKLPVLLDVIHRLIEGKARGRQFILTGSSARKLRRTGVNLLAGRLLWRQFHPYIACELGHRFNLEKVLQTGMVPLVLASKKPFETLKSYVSLYIHQEVREEASVRDLGGFSRFLEAISLSHAGQLNLSAVASDCSVTRRSAEGYVEVLEDMMLAFRLRIFKKRARRLLASHPKFYFFDPGVYQVVRPRNPLDSGHEIGGGALEGLVGQHLRVWIWSQSGRNDLFFWRTRAGLEVDFVLFGESGLYAFEVKSKGKIKARDLAGLKAFLKDYPEAMVALLSRTPVPKEIDGIPCMDIKSFLLGIIPGKPLSLESSS